MYVFKNAQRSVSSHNKKWFSLWGRAYECVGFFKKNCFVLLNGYKILIYNKEMEGIPTW